MPPPPRSGLRGHSDEAAWRAVALPDRQRGGGLPIFPDNAWGRLASTAGPHMRAGALQGPRARRPHPARSRPRTRLTWRRAHEIRVGGAEPDKTRVMVVPFETLF